MVLTWSEATKPMELKPEESWVMICWVMTVDPIAASAVRHTFYHVLFLSQICWGQHSCTPFLRTTMSTHVNTIHIYMLTILDFKSWVHIHITHRWVVSSVPNEVNPSIARRKQGLLDWTSERVLNWPFLFLWLVGVTTPKLLYKQNLVKKLVDVSPCHLPFLSIFLLVRGAVTLYAKERLVYALSFSAHKV